MEILSALHTDVKLLLVAAALALVAALVSGSKKKEYQYVAIFALLMAVAGVRFKQEERQGAIEAARSQSSVAGVLEPAPARPARTR